MIEMNQTKLMEILLLGFQNPPSYNAAIFLLFLVTYIFILVGNLMIVILVSKVQSLKSPMYFFLTQLSLCDILLSTAIVPEMLHVVINGGSTIYLNICITQFGIHGVSEGTECYILAVMSYDRYLAICRPLHYTSIMSFRLCFQFTLFCWALSSMTTFTITYLLSSLRFCGHVIDHYFCDFLFLIELSCTKHTAAEQFDFVAGIPYLGIPFFFIIFTYVSISITILGISSSTGRQKAFSTCSSHITVVCVFYGTLIVVYIAPTKGYSFNISKVLSLLYTVICPFFNPIIYSLRNQDIKVGLKKLLSISLRGI